MSFTFTYLLSQIFVFIYYTLQIVTYQLKSRNKILIINFVAILMMGISYYFLSAYTGMAMVVVGTVRNLLFYFNKEKTDKITKRNIMELVIITLVLVVSTIFTYDGFFSLMSVFATYLYTISIWQKNTKVYKILGFFVAVAGILYNIYVFSILGIAFESFSLLSAVIGAIRETYEKKAKRKRED